MNRPPAAAEGTVALVSPSSDTAASIPHRVDSARTALEDLGFSVVEYETTRSERGHGSEAAARRAETLVDAFADPDVDVVLPTIGGYRSNTLFEHLDFDRIAANPTILVGYSDITALCLSIYSRADLVTFLGPTAMPELGEYPAPFEYTLDGFVAAVAGSVTGPLTASSEWTDEYLEWSDRSDGERPRERFPNPGYEWLRVGTGSGPLVGGNLPTVAGLSDPYRPSFEGSVLLLEDNGVDSVRQTERHLTTLRNGGVLSAISALVFGRYGPPDSADVDVLRDVLVDVTRGYEYPVLYGVDFGHTDPMFTVPVGCRATVDASAGTFRIAEEGVR